MDSFQLFPENRIAAFLVAIDHHPTAGEPLDLQDRSELEPLCRDRWFVIDQRPVEDIAATAAFNVRRMDEQIGIRTSRTTTLVPAAKVDELIQRLPKAGLQTITESLIATHAFREVDKQKAHDFLDAWFAFEGLSSLGRALYDVLLELKRDLKIPAHLRGG